MKQIMDCTQPKYICANERIKLIGTLDGKFPDFGHHLQDEMGGLWLHPIKVLDGFWMELTEHASDTSCWILANKFENYPEKNVLYFRKKLGDSFISAIRTQIAPDYVAGIVVSYEFTNQGKKSCEYTTRFLVRSDLRPGWLAECSDVYDGESDVAVFDEQKNCFMIKDCANPWFAAVGADEKCSDYGQGKFYGPEITSGNGTAVVLEHHFCLAAGEKKELKFFIAASDISENDLYREYEKLKQQKDFEVEKRKRYEKKYEISDLQVEDERFEEIYRWIKVNSDWLVLETSRGDRGIMAGAPEYVWWFGCDSCYTVQGLLAIGEYQLCKDTLLLILEYSRKINGNGRIVHEILPDGYCPNCGNVQETAHYITTVWKYHEWTGDCSLLEEAFDYLTLGIQWLQAQCEEGSYFPKGYGITEIEGLNMEMIDTIIYTWEAYVCYGKMCQFMGQKEDAAYFEKLARELQEKIEEKMWDENSGLYCDGYASYNFIKERNEMVESLLAKSRNDHVKEYFLKTFEERKEEGETKRGWLLNQNWVINIPMESGLASEEHAKRALENMHTSDFIGYYGVYLCAMRQEEIMTISTGVMSAAQARYGYADRALELIEKTFDTFGMSTPGSICEYSPDGGCFVQAWTVYELYTIVRYFFGIQPSASENKVEINPCMPLKWKKATLKNVKVLDGEISIFYKETEGEKVIQIENPCGLNVCVDNHAKNIVSVNEKIMENEIITIKEKSITIIKN